MRDEQVRDPLLLAEVAHEIEDRRLDGRVEVGDRLVADDDARLAGEGARERDPLLRPARERVRAELEVARREADEGREIVERRGTVGVPDEAERAAEDPPTEREG